MSDFLDWSTLIYRAPALLIAMALHEYAHAYVSDSLGDPTPSMQGRLTANPLVHLDMVGLMLLVICGFGWAKPVEINPNYYKNFRSGVMKVSFAGPGMNLLICFLAECIMLLMMKLGLLTAGLPGKLAFAFHNFSYRYSFLLLLFLVFSGMIGRIINPLAQFYTGTTIRLIASVLQM